METIVFATNNPHKLREIRSLLGNNPEVKSLKDMGFYEDIPEPFDTLEKNARAKSATIASRFGLACFADDTGLEVEALDGKPGVFSARYAGPDANSKNNIQKLLQELQGETNRKARFRTVISLMLNGTEYRFEGMVAGVILTEEHGHDGFGYDPVFKPDGYDQSFAEMDPELKNRISHRGIAVRKLADFLKQRFGQRV
jgi:XTP/dITP diphosphohydrolase